VAVSFATLGIWGRGFPIGHDIEWEIVRIREYHGVLGEVAWPPRWAPGLARGYGSPIFNFFPPAFLTLASGLMHLALPIGAALKLSLVILSLVSWFGMWQLLRAAGAGRTLASLGATAYLVAPYRFFDAYGRDAFSELTALSVIPWVLAALETTLRERVRARHVVGLAIATAILSVSHNLSLAMYAPLIALRCLVALWPPREPRRLLPALGGLMLGFGLAAFFLGPAVLEVKHVRFGFSAAGAPKTIDALLGWRELSEGIPLTTVVFLTPLLALALPVLWQRSETPTSRDLARSSLVYALVALCMTLWITRPLWSACRFLDPFAFPWRWFGPATLGATVSVALAGDGRARQTTLAVLIAAASLATTNVLTFPRISMDRADLQPTVYRRTWQTTTMIDEYRPRVVRRRPDVPAETTFLCEAPARCRPEMERPTVRRTWVESPRPTAVIGQVLQFPGWVARVDGRVVQGTVVASGLLQLRVPEGRHRVSLTYEGTPIQHASESVSLLALLVTLGLLVGDWLRARRERALASGPELRNPCCAESWRCPRASALRHSDAPTAPALRTRTTRAPSQSVCLSEFRSRSG
jgi:hypothetical protein